MNNTNDYTKELLSLKTEVESLKTIIAMAVEQIKHAITSLTVTTSKPVSNDMETDADSLETTNINPTQPDPPSLIADLKHKIATIVIKTHAMFH